jgi:hypothetical protein
MSYDSLLLSYSPTAWWKLADAAGSSTAVDSSGNGNTATVQGSATFGEAGPIPSETDTAMGLAGASYLSTATAYADPAVYSQVVWFNTTSDGGLVMFGDTATGSPSSYDRFVWVDAGAVYTGVYISGADIIGSPASTYADGDWHMAVATLSGAGLFLYMDGALVASNTSYTSAQSYTGYWRIGEMESGWAPAPSDYEFTGTLAQVAILPTALTAAQVTDLWTAAQASVASPIVMII